MQNKYGYVISNNVCLFQKGPLSQWWGGYSGQIGGFEILATDYAELSWKYHKISDVGNYINNKMSGEIISVNCCEQHMMLAKAAVCDDIETFRILLKEKNPKAQKDFGRRVKNFISANWDKEKFNIVLNGNYRKFSGNNELKNFLLSFNSHIIFAEAAPWDKIWGIGLGPDDPKALDVTKWNGSNLLGGAIRMVRDKLVYEDNI